MQRYEHHTTDPTGQAYVNGASWRVQTFTVGTTGPNEDHTITSVKLQLYRTGSPGTMMVSIREVDADGFPTGDDLSTGTINGNTLTENAIGEWYEIAMTPAVLSSGTQYAIVARAPAGDSNNTVSWRMAFNTPYLAGRAGYSLESGTRWSWHSDGPDFMFEVWGSPYPMEPPAPNYLLYGGVGLLILALLVLATRKKK